MDENKWPQENSTPSSPEEEVRSLRRAVEQLNARVEKLERSQSTGTSLPSAFSPGRMVPSPRTESRVGLTLLNRVGALTLAIGIILFFKYAVDNSWVGAEARVILGALAGLAMLASAEWIRKRPEQLIFAQGVTGCGLATLYAASYASVAYYELLIPVAGWLLLAAVSAIAVALSIRYDSSAIAALGFAGALCTPMLLLNRGMPPWFHFAYLLLVNVVGLLLSARRGWLVLLPPLAVLGMVAAAVVLEPHHSVAFATYCALLAVGHWIAGRKSSVAYLTGHACLLIAAMRLLALWKGDSNDRWSFISAAESFLLAAYGAAALFFGVLRKARPDRMLGLLLIGLVVAKLYLWDVWQLSKFYRLSAFVLLGVLLLGASYFYSRLRAKAAD